jgi:thioredoxin-related protein
LGFQQPASAGQVFTNVAQAQAAAKAHHKNLLVYWTGQGWCPYCSSLDKGVMNKPQIASWIRSNVVFCKVNCQNGKNWGAAAHKYKVNTVPTRILLDPNGKVLAKGVGYGGKGTPKSFIGWMSSRENTNEAGSQSK